MKCKRGTKPLRLVLRPGPYGTPELRLEGNHYTFSALVAQYLNRWYVSPESKIPMWLMAALVSSGTCAVSVNGRLAYSARKWLKEQGVMK